MKKTWILCMCLFLFSGCINHTASKAEEQVEDQTSYTQKQWKYAQGNGQVWFTSLEETGIEAIEVPSTLPVLKDVNGMSISKDALYHQSEAQMREQLTNYENVLQWVDPMEQVFYCDQGSFCEKGNATQIIHTYAQGKISVDHDGSILLELNQSETLKPYTNYSTYEQQLHHLMKEYAFLLPKDSDVTSFCDQNYDHDYHCTSTIFEDKESVEEALIAQVERSYSIDSFDHVVLLTDRQKEVEKEGSYPIKSVQQAEKEMRRGNFYKAGGELALSDEMEVVLWELRYMQPESEYLYPFYIFYLDLHQTEHDMPVYQMVYVPAMMDADLIQYENEQQALR